MIRCMNSSGFITRWGGAIAPGRLELQHHLARGVRLHALVGQSGRMPSLFADQPTGNLDRRTADSA